MWIPRGDVDARDKAIMGALFYFIECIQSGEYPDPLTVSKFYAATWADKNRVTDVFTNGQKDSWYLLAIARRYGSANQVQELVKRAYMLGALSDSEDVFEDTREMSLITEANASGRTLTQYKEIQAIRDKLVWFYEEILGALNRGEKISKPDDEIVDELNDVVGYLRFLEDVTDDIATYIDLLPYTSKIPLEGVKDPASLAILRATMPAFRDLLREDESLLIATEATLMDMSKRIGPGTFQGVLAITNQGVHFVHNKYFHEPLWDLPDREYWSKAEFRKFKKGAVRDYLPNGVPIKVADGLQLLFSASGRLADTQFLTFRVPDARIKQFTNFSF